MAYFSWPLQSPVRGKPYAPSGIGVYHHDLLQSSIQHQVQSKTNISSLLMCTASAYDEYSAPFCPSPSQGLRESSIWAQVAGVCIRGLRERITSCSCTGVSGGSCASKEPSHAAGARRGQSQLGTYTPHIVKTLAYKHWIRDV